MYLVAIHIHPIRPYVKRESEFSILLKIQIPFIYSIYLSPHRIHFPIPQSRSQAYLILSFCLMLSGNFLPFCPGVCRGDWQSPLCVILKIHFYKVFYFTKTLSKCQISSTYSWIVLSDVNLPAHAVFSIAIRAQPFSSL